MRLADQYLSVAPSLALPTLKETTLDHGKRKKGEYNNMEYQMISIVHRSFHV